MTWDRGIRRHLELVTAPDLTADSLKLWFVRDDHLRAPNGSEEDQYIAQLIKTSYREAERVTWRALVQQTWELVMNRFPYGEIVLPKPPLQSVTSITYIDSDGAEQQLLGSPADVDFQVIMPSGPTAQKGRIVPAYNESWPSTRAVPNAVRVRFIAGYPDGEVPEDIDHGRLLMIGELYKQRSESVHAFNQTPALIRANSLWMRYRAF